MKYLKKFDTLENAYQEKHTIPFVGSVSGIERKAVYGSKHNISYEGTVLKDKETGFLKTLPNIVVGKAIKPTSMPYLWYYSSTYLKILLPYCNGKYVDVYVDGKFDFRSRGNKTYELVGLDNHFLTRLAKFEYNKDTSENVKCYLETIRFYGNATTTTKGVIIKNYEIVNIRPTILNDYHLFGDGYQHITATRPYKRQYLARLNPSYKDKYGQTQWLPAIRKFTKHGTCRNRCIMKVVNIAKKRWKSIHPIIFDKMYPLEIWEPNS